MGRGWPSLATQAIGDGGPPAVWDRICMLFGWPQTFVPDGRLQ